MKHALYALACLFTLATLAADEADLLAADDARIATMKMADRAKLSAIFSDDLHYAHSNGVVETKSSFVDSLVSGRTRYLEYDHVERKVSFPTPGMALVSGRARIQASSDKGTMDSILSYLAVWRLEDGRWRFLAWQSCKLPPTNP